MKLERRKAGFLLFFFLGTNNKAAQRSMAECKLQLVLFRYSCYRCSLIHLVIDYVFNEEGELNRIRPNTAVLTLINVGVRDQGKIPEAFRGSKT